MIDPVHPPHPAASSDKIVAGKSGQAQKVAQNDGTAISLHSPWRVCHGETAVIERGSPLEHDPEKHALELDPMGGYRFSEKIMLRQRSRARCRFYFALSRFREPKWGAHLRWS